MLPFSFPSSVLQEGMRTAVTCQTIQGDLPIHFTWTRLVYLPIHFTWTRLVYLPVHFTWTRLVYLPVHFTWTKFCLPEFLSKDAYLRLCFAKARLAREEY